MEALAGLPMVYVEVPTRSEVRAHLIANCVITAIGLGVVGGRIAARKMLCVGLGYDDWLILFAVPFCLALLVLQGNYSVLGSGYPLMEVVFNLPIIMRITTAFQIIYLVALTAIKSSIICFYLRIFAGNDMVRPCYIVLGIVLCWGFGHFLAVMFICSPVASQWDLSVPGTCGNQIKLFQSIIATNIITDAAIMLLPIYTIAHLQMPLRDKLGIMTCFLIGIACIVAAIFRLVYVTAVDMVADITGTMPTTVFLAALEPNLALICSSLPMLRPFYTRYKAKSSSAKLSDPSGNFESNLKDSSNNSSQNRGVHGQNVPAKQDPNVRNRDVEMDALDLVQQGHEFDCRVERQSTPTNNSTTNDSGSEEYLYGGHPNSGITIKRSWRTDVDKRG